MGTRIQLKLLGGSEYAVPRGISISRQVTIMIYRVHRHQKLPASLDQVWEYFSRPENLNEITPPDINFQILQGGNQPMYPGQLIEYRVQFFPLLTSRWLTEITQVQNRVYFVDERRVGPYTFWHHQHRFKSIPGGTEMTDLVTYQLPYGWLGDLVHSLWVSHRLKAIFDYMSNNIGLLFSGS
jgi:ligand-binding SRPBCC domain-containing protein